ncbi:hypothetical protein BJ170DRAFT_623583 [Xylariales sp. AK1849]|nr:hypothetical protein BJ170DRAFT_623583 [Xylariales sp. AK1849]
MLDTRGELGLSCPSEGKFYVCDTAIIRFIGCCTVDPCADGTGNCPTSSLRPWSFSSDHYDKISEQSCVAPATDDAWWSCQSSSPPFLGCCKSNACNQGGCPTADLIAARLSDNATNAQVFLDASTRITSSTPTPTATADPSPQSSGVTLSTGATVGIALGAATVFFVLLGILAYKCGWWARHRKAEEESENGSRASGSTLGDARKPPATSYQGSVDECPAAVSPANANYCEEQQRSGMRSHPTSPYSPGFGPQSPDQVYEAPAASPHQHHTALAPTEAWTIDSRHASQISGVSWHSIATSVAHKQHPEWMELDGRETERPRRISELPASYR